MKYLVAETTIKIPFHDVDDMSVVWHVHYMNYFEVARGDLFESFDLQFPDPKFRRIFGKVVLRQPFPQFR